MKAKHWIVVGVIAVVCVSAAVMIGNKTPEDGVSVGASTVNSEPTITEETTITAEPSEGAADKEKYDTSITEDANNGETDTVVTTEETKAEEQVDTAPDRAPTKDEAFESKVQSYIKDFGISREEAEKFILDAQEEGKRRQAKAQEESNQRRAEEQARHDEASRRMKEATGVSQEEFTAMSNTERLDYMKKHPGVSFDIDSYRTN